MFCNHEYLLFERKGMKEAVAATLFMCRHLWFSFTQGLLFGYIALSVLLLCILSAANSLIIIPRSD